MIANIPGKAVWLDIPGDCHISGEFTGDYDIHVMFGGPRDGVDLLFKRIALERFVALATELLAVSVPDDPHTELPKLHAPATIINPVVSEAGTVRHMHGRPRDHQ
jgi:hypothetical protein